MIDSGDRGGGPPADEQGPAPLQLPDPIGSGQLRAEEGEALARGPQQSRLGLTLVAVATALGMVILLLSVGPFSADLKAVFLLLLSIASLAVLIFGGWFLKQGSLHLDEAYRKSCGLGFNLLLLGLLIGLISAIYLYGVFPEQVLRVLGSKSRSFAELLPTIRLLVVVDVLSSIVLAVALYKMLRGVLQPPGTAFLFLATVLSPVFAIIAQFQFLLDMQSSIPALDAARNAGDGATLMRVLGAAAMKSSILSLLSLISGLLYILACQGGHKSLGTQAGIPPQDGPSVREEAPASRNLE